MRKNDTMAAEISAYQNAMLATSKPLDQIASDLDTASAALDCLGDMLGHLGDLADAAKEGSQAQTFYCLSNSVKAIHESVGAITRAAEQLRHQVGGIVIVPAIERAAVRGKAVR